MDTAKHVQSYERQWDEANAPCEVTVPHYHQDMTGDIWLDQARQAWRCDFYRWTAPREVVLRQIAMIPTPFAAERLVADLTVNTTGSAGSRATAYRVIHWLRTHGWLARVQSDAAHAGYIRQIPHHHSVVCVICGVTLLVGGWDLEAQLASSLTGTNFELQGHVLELYGRCGACRSGRPSQAARVSPQ